MGNYMRCELLEGMGGLAEKMGGGFENDTEVAQKDACVLGAGSLKRKCSQLSGSN